MQVHIMENGQIILIGKAHMVYVNPAFHTGKHCGIRRILHGRLLSLIHI